MTTAEQAEYARLCAWWLAWTPPAEPYFLDAWTQVTEPERFYRWVCAAIAEGRSGQMQRALLDHLRRHYRLFGGRDA